MNANSLRRRSYAFWIVSRFYWCVSMVCSITVVACGAVTAVLTTQPNIDQYQKTILALSVTGAVLTSLQSVTGFPENSATCRDISRSLDTLANDFSKGRVDELQTERRLLKIRRRVPIGTCLFLRIT